MKRLLVVACAALLAGCMPGAWLLSAEAVKAAEKACEPNGGLHVVRGLHVRPHGFKAVCKNGLVIEGRAK